MAKTKSATTDGWEIICWWLAFDLSVFVRRSLSANQRPNPAGLGSHSPSCKWLMQSSLSSASVLFFGCFGSDVVNGSAAWGMPVKVKLDAALIAC